MQRVNGDPRASRTTASFRFTGGAPFFFGHRIRRCLYAAFVLAIWAHAHLVRILPVFRPEFHGVVPARSAAGADRAGAGTGHATARLDGGGAHPVRRGVAPGAGHAGRPYRRQARRRGGAVGGDRLVVWCLATRRAQHGPGAAAGRAARHCRRLVCCGAAAGIALVPAGTPGHGDGHCRRRQLRHGAGGLVRADAGAGIRLPERVRAGVHSAGADAARVCVDCPRSAHTGCAQALGRLRPRAGWQSRRMALHVFLLSDLWRLLRICQRVAGLLPRPVRFRCAHRGLGHGRLRAGRPAR